MNQFLINFIVQLAVALLSLLTAAAMIAAFLAFAAGIMTYPWLTVIGTVVLICLVSAAAETFK